jgi:polyhydroxyalkanoate synthesis regulator phasin
MLNTLKDTLLASIGAVAFKKDRLKKIIEEMVIKGDLTEDQADNLFDTLISRGRQESEEISGRIYRELNSIRELLPVSRREFQDLEARVLALEPGGMGTSGMGTSGMGASATGSSDEVDMPSEYPGEALPPRG